ncbi:uncharacterized protein [Antedon mediterranea]|uniref:uncharacterized protein n=1 Tax=Antedon mediterranea TaxID=105859 RepID=UPI003AF93B16
MATTRSKKPDNVSFEEFVKESLSNIMKSQNNLDSKLAESIKFNEDRIIALEKAQSRYEARQAELVDDLHTARNTIASMQAELNKAERFSRRNNIRIVGIAKSDNENPINIVEDFLATHFKIKPTIERAHRDGLGFEGKPPHILFKVLSYVDKVTILKNRHKLASSGAYIIDDLTRTDRQEKNKWKTQVKALYDQGIKLRFRAGKWRSSTGIPHAFK